MPTVDSVNVKFGTDLSNLEAGAKQVGKIVETVVQKIAKANLHGAIKGDPFSGINNAVKQAQTGIKQYADQWMKELSNIEKRVDRYTRLSIQSFKRLEDSLGRLLQRKQELYSQKFGIGGTGGFADFKSKVMDFSAFTHPGTGEDQKAALGAGINKDFQKYLENLKKLYPQANKVIDQFLQKVTTGVKLSRDQVDKDLKKLYADLSGKAKLVQNQIDDFGKKLKASADSQARIKFMGQLSAAKDEEAALKRKTQALRESYVAEARARTEIKLGINVAKNKIVVLRELEKRQRLGTNLTKQQTLELKRLRSQFNRLNAEAAGTKPTGFLSPQWFKQRIGWFIQLRGFWMAWRLAVESFREAFDFEQSMKNVQAIARTTTEQFELLRQRALEIGTTTKYSAREASDAMVVMAQAGLATDEIFNSIKHTAHLATGTLHDLKETAKLVTTIMRAWNIESQDSQRIVDVLATGINRTKLNMEDLGTAFNYITGVAPQLNISLEETVAMLGTMRNRGIKASTMSTSLRAVLSSLLKPTDAFREQVHKLKLTMDDVNPQLYNVQTIFKTLKDAGWQAAHSFKAFRRRAASGATVMIDSADNMADLTTQLNSFGRAAGMAEVQLDTVQSQWKLFKDEAVKIAATINEDTTPSVIGLIGVLKTLLRSLYALKPILLVVGKIFEGWRYLGTIAFEGISGLEAQFHDDKIREATNALADNNKESQRTIERYRELQKVYGKYIQAVDLGKKRGGRIQLDQEKRAMRYAVDAKLIKEEEIEVIKKSNTEEEARRIIEEKINTAYKARLGMLAGEYKQLTENQKVLQETHRALVLAKIRDMEKEFTEVTNSIIEAEKSQKDLLKAYGEGADIGLEDDLMRLQVELTKFGERFKRFYQVELLDAEREMLFETSEIFRKMVEILRIESLEGIKYVDAFRKSLQNAGDIVFTEDDIKMLQRVAGTPTEVVDPTETTDDKKIEKLIAKYKGLEAVKKRDLVLAKDRNADAALLNKIELSTLELQRERAQKQKDLLSTDEIAKIKDLQTEIYEIDTQILLKEKEIVRNSSAWAGAMYDLQNSFKTSTQAWREFITGAAESISRAGTNAITGLVTGFPEARQEAENLEVQLEDLEKQYKQALGEGRVEEAKRIKEEMKGLNNQIDDLRDSGKQVANSFKEMAKGILDSLQKVIQELIAARMAALLFGEAAGNKVNVGDTSVGLDWGGLISGVLGGLFGASGAKGGVFNQIKAFRSFSSGGITGNSTMAILGDNPSKKELVIPSENIKSNRVEGYTRDKQREDQPITILNLLTKQDIVRAMASSEGKHVIINHIGKDLNNHGPVAKRIGR